MKTEIPVGGGWEQVVPRRIVNGEWFIRMRKNAKRF
jgi:hypothetical protein